MHVARLPRCPGCARQGDAAVAGLPRLQYNFTVVEAGCTSNCTVIVITSNSSTVNIPGLEPGTKVGVAGMAVPVGVVACMLPVVAGTASSHARTAAWPAVQRDRGGHRRQRRHHPRRRRGSVHHPAHVGDHVGQRQQSLERQRHCEAVAQQSVCVGGLRRPMGRACGCLVGARE